MSFPNQDSINESLISILKTSEINGAKIILSDIYFKIGVPSESIKVLKENNLYNELLSITINLDTIKEYELAQDLYLYIINNAENKQIIQKTIYEFAKSLEKRSISNKSILPLSSFMYENDYFNSPFIRVDETGSEYLYQAISMYDSLSNRRNDMNSLFRLSEIHFRVLGDLDKALDIYKKINLSTNSKDLKLKAIKHPKIQVLCPYQR